MKKIKAVVFDFDGTLTKSNENIWKRIYQKINYPVDKTSSYYTSYVDYINNKIDYNTWVEIGEKDFIAGRLTKSMFYEICSDYKLFNGVIETLLKLKNDNIKLYVLSGNFVEAIKFVFQENSNLFEDISANQIRFYKNGNIEKLISTKYDFEGKATYLQNLIKNNNLSSDEICFVGNGDNDIYAYQAGVKTICINPVNANESNKTIWSNVIKPCTDLNEILEFIK